MTKTSRLDFPYFPAHRHKIRLLEIMGQADIEAALILLAEVPLKYEGKRAEEKAARIESSLFQIRAETNKKIGCARDGFLDQWNLWRTLLPVCSVTGLQPLKITSHSRTADIVRPRHVWFWLAVEVGGVKTSSVAELTGRNHSTVYHSRVAVEEQLEAGRGDLVDILTDVLEFESARAT